MAREWRCIKCGKLLGIIKDARIHLKFSRGYDYLVGYPATTVCPGCRSLNELAAPPNSQALRATTAQG